MALKLETLWNFETNNSIMSKNKLIITPQTKVGELLDAYPELEKVFTASELTKIVAVTNIVVNPSRSMDVHEPTQMAMFAGVNQLYAEVGANPRDTKSDTEQSRGFTPERAWDMLWEAGYRNN